MHKDLSSRNPLRRGAAGGSNAGIRNNSGLLLKMVGLSSSFMLLVIFVFAVMSIINMRSLSHLTALVMGEKKLGGDMASFGFML
ncbi:MAG: hypothetical protein LBD24_00300, partial [Spirochaetaceae bacterium]|nr:hypothetical protein [Spirochaetaceae bacterium]